MQLEEMYDDPESEYVAIPGNVQLLYTSVPLTGAWLCLSLGRWSRRKLRERDETAGYQKDLPSQHGDGLVTVVQLDKLKEVAWTDQDLAPIWV